MLVLFGLVGAAFIYVRQAQTAAPKLPQASDALPRAEWFVSPEGRDSNDGTSLNHAFATIQKAVDKAMPGQAIKLQDGTYTQSFHTVRDGSRDKPITIMGSPKVQVVGAAYRIVEIHHDYIRLTGFTVNGHNGSSQTKNDYRDKLIWVIGVHANNGVMGLKLDHLLIENAGGECVRLRYFAQYNEISHVVIKNCGIYDFRFHDKGKNGEGIYVGTAPEQRDNGKNPTAAPDQSTHNWIHDNYIETHGNECVDIKEASHDNLVEHNECTGQSDPESGGFDARGDHNTFRYNFIHDNVGAGVRLGGDKTNDGTKNDVYGNTIKNNQGLGIKVLRGPQGKVCDNTFTDNQDGEIGGAADDAVSAGACKT